MAYTLNLSLSKLCPPGKFRSFINGLGKLQEFRLLICGNYISDGLHAFFTKKKEDLPILFQLVKTELVRIREKEKIAGIVFKEFDEEECKHADTLIKDGYVCVSSLPYHYLPIKWNSLKEYKMAIKKRYRQSFNKSEKKIQVDQIRIELSNAIDDEIIVEKMYELYLYVHERAAFQLEKIKPLFFNTICKQMGTKANLLLIKEEEKIIGFTIFLDDGPKLQALFLGYDAGLNKKYDIYFNIVFALLDCAIKRKKRELSLGQTADQFKVRLGCLNSNKYFLFKFHNKFVHWLLKMIVPALFTQPKIVDMKVFKQV